MGAKQSRALSRRPKKSLLDLLKAYLAVGPGVGFLGGLETMKTYEHHPIVEGDYHETH